jgi:hypothetical protein
MMKSRRREKDSPDGWRRALSFSFFSNLTLRFKGGNVHTKLTHTSESEVDMYFNIYK